MNQIQSLDTIETPVFVTLISKDNQSFTINKEYACISNLISTALSEDKEETSLTLEAVNGNSLKYIVQYMEEYKGKEPNAPLPPLHQNFEEVVDTFCFNFTSTLCKEKVLKEVFESANYLNIPELLQILGCKVAALIKGVPIEDIEKVLNDC
jgi:hypothetical protein